MEQLSPAVRRELLAAATPRQLAVDEVLYVAGEPADTLYLVLEGKVRLVRERGGRSMLIHEEMGGGALGEVPLFEGTTYPATAIAAEPTRVLALSRTVVLASVRQHPELALAILTRLSARVRTLIERIERYTTQSTVSRLAELVLARSREADGRSFTLGANQQQVAEELGTVRELVVRGLRALRTRGAIEARGGGRYTVRNADELMRLARAE